MNIFQELNALVEEDDNTEKAKNVFNDIKIATNKKFDPNAPLTDREASNIIQQAHDKAEEVDTVAYGLELNDGEIVKVYVNAEQAEEFDKAMAELLGKEDDIEAAINKLADNFDIVSVEWPEDYQAATTTNPDGTMADEEVPNDESNAPEKKVQLSFQLNKKDEVAKSNEEESNDKKGDEEEQQDGMGFDGDKSEEESDLDISSDEPKKDEEEAGDEIGFGTDEEESSDEEEVTDKKKKKKKEKPVKEGIQNFWEDFPEINLLTENSERNSEDMFSSANQRKIIKLILLLGMPENRLALAKTKLRHGIREVSLQMNNNTKARTFVNRSIHELEQMVDMKAINRKEKELEKAETVDEALGNNLTELYNNILEILKSLGVPEHLLHTKRAQLKQQMRPTIAMIAKHTKIRTILGNLGKELGHAHHVSKEEELTESVRLGSDTYMKMVSSVLSALGVPDENLVYKKVDLIKSLRAKSEKVNISAVRAKAIPFVKELNNSEMTESFVLENEYSQRNKAQDLGGWSFTKTGSSLKLAIANLIIKLDTKESKRLMNAIDDGFETIVKSGSEHYDFKPISNGLQYAVIPLDSHEFHDGIKMNKEDVQQLLDLF